MPDDRQPTLPYATPRVARPTWVKLGLWGTGGRAGAMAFLWLCAAFAVASVPIAVATGDARWLLGVSSILPSLWYWLAIRWVDRHGTWSPTAVVG